MCNHYFYAGDVLTAMTASSNTGALRVEHNSRGLPKDGWRCLCALDLDQDVLARHLRSSGQGFIIKPKTRSRYNGDGRFGRIASPSHPSMIGSGRLCPIPSFPESITNPFTIAFALLGHTSANHNHDILLSPSRSHSDADVSHHVADDDCEEPANLKHITLMAPSSSDDEASSGDSPDDSYLDTKSLISDAEVQERLLEPALNIELERLLLRKPSSIQYPIPRRTVMLQNSEGGPLEKVNEQIVRYQKVIYTEDPQMVLWEGIRERVEWGAERIQEKRAEDNCDPFIFLNHRKEFNDLLDDPLTLDDHLPDGLMDSIKDHWETLTVRYGDFDILQNEQAMFVNKLFSVLFHYQEAVASHSLVTKDAVTCLLYSLVEAMKEFFAIDYGFRVYVVERLASEGSGSHFSE